MSEQPWEEIEHTADWALRVWGADRRALFENAARGMASLSGGQRLPGPEVHRRFDLSAPDWETLLVDWLTELLYLIEAENLVFSEIVVHTAAECALSAEARGSPGEHLNKHIKAVTYHNLAIEQTPQGYVVTVVFDV